MVLKDRQQPDERRRNTPESQAQFDALLHAAVDAIILIDTRGRVTHFNAAAEKMFGYAPSDIIGKNINCLMPEPYHGQHDGYLDHYRETGEARIIGIGREVTARRSDGSVFPIELTVGEIRYALQSGFVGIIRDASRRKMVEEQLRMQEEELRLIFESATTAIATVNLDGSLLNANHAWCDLFGYTESEMRSLQYADVVYPEDREIGRESDGQLQRGEIDSSQLIRRYLCKDGSVIECNTHKSVMRDSQGQPMLLLVEHIDLTAQRAAQVEANELRNRLTHVGRINTLGEMATGIAHELNQPLSAITNYANASRRLIGSGQGEPAEIVDALEKIAIQAERAGEVIRRLRSMLVQRVDPREPVGAGHLVREVIRLAELEIRERNILLRLDFSEQVPELYLDTVQLQQVLLNLIRNAMDSMSEIRVGAEIAIAVRQPDDNTVEISVSDTGHGISERAASRLFEPFFTTKPQGLGMGLAICRTIVQTHGGNLSFFNNPKGGATFVISLPVQAKGGGR